MPEPCRRCLATLMLVLPAICGCSSEPQPAGDPTATAPTEPSTEPAVEPPFQPEPGFTLLTFDDFEAFQAEEDTWMPEGNGIRCSGKPRGYLYSKARYDNFTLRLDYRFDRPANLKDDAAFKGNTGFLVYVTGEHKLWPVSLEVQGKYAEMGRIKENGGAKPVTIEDNETARREARALVGEWQAIEIVSHDGAISASINGTEVCRSEPGELREGAIGIQAEDFPFAVRNLRIQTGGE